MQHPAMKRTNQLPRLTEEHNDSLIFRHTHQKWKTNRIETGHLHKPSIWCPGDAGISPKFGPWTTAKAITIAKSLAWPRFISQTRKDTNSMIRGGKQNMQIYYGWSFNPKRLANSTQFILVFSMTKRRGSQEPCAKADLSRQLRPLGAASHGEVTGVAWHKKWATSPMLFMVTIHANPRSKFHPCHLSC